MAKRREKSPKVAPVEPTKQDVPPGATRRAFDRDLESGGGLPGSAAGPRHAAQDEGNEEETTGPMDSNRTLASQPVEEDDLLEEDAPFASRSGAAIGACSASHPTRKNHIVVMPITRSARATPGYSGATEKPRIPRDHEGTDTMKLTGFEAIEYAEKRGLSLNKHPDSITGPRQDLSVAEAIALAEDDPELIWLVVDREEYYSGTPSSYEPDY